MISRQTSTASIDRDLALDDLHECEAWLYHHKDGCMGDLLEQFEEHGFNVDHGLMDASTPLADCNGVVLDMMHGPSGGINMRVVVDQYALNVQDIIQ
jgi:hypothetical protein